MGDLPVRYVVCEGPDDLGALRALVRDLLPDCRLEGSKYKRKIVISTGPVQLEFVAADGAKSDLAARTLELAEGGSGNRPDAIGVIFDPDADRPERELAFFTKDYNRLSQTEQRGSKLKETKGGFLVTINGRDVRILAAPWRSLQPTRFDDLPNEHDLERVLISGILDAYGDDELVDWALESTTKLRELVEGHGWKRAFRIWGRPSNPRASPSSIVCSRPLERSAPVSTRSKRLPSRS